MPAMYYCRVINKALELKINKDMHPTMFLLLVTDTTHVLLHPQQFVDALEIGLVTVSQYPCIAQCYILLQLEIAQSSKLLLRVAISASTIFLLLVHLWPCLHREVEVLNANVIFHGRTSETCKTLPLANHVAHYAQVR